MANMEECLLPPEKSAQKSFDLEVGDDVMFDGAATVTGFSGGRVKVDFHGRKMWFHPGQLRKSTVNPMLKKVLQIFCGYIDMWFLRETFVTDFAPEKESVKDLVEAQASMIFSELGMDKWTKEYQFIHCTFVLYLRRVLSPSVYFFKKYTKALFAAMGSVLLLLLLVSLWGFANLRSGDTDEQANARGAKAFSAVEHAPVTPFILALCTHVIMMIFASEQLRGLMQSDRNLAFPLTYTIFIGKGFMLVRMVLAYSSKNLGVSIDYFIWQELILTSLHACLALFVGDPVAPEAATAPDGSARTPPRWKGLSYAKQLSHACLFVFCIDLMKTLAVVIYWWTYREGAIAYYFNRLPSIQVMLAASILAHAVLDLVQFIVTAFTMLIGRIFLALTKDQSIPEYQEVEEQEPEPDIVSAKPAEEREPDIFSAKPAAELDDMVKNLSGFWKIKSTGRAGAVSKSEDVEIEAKSWTMPIPDGLSDGSWFLFPTVYKLGIPKVHMHVQVPKGLRSGSPFRFVELRVFHAASGYYSIDASALDSTEGLRLLYNVIQRSMYISAQWIDDGNGPVIKFKGTT